MLPTTCFRIADGEVEISQTLAGADIIDRTNAPDLTLPVSEEKPEVLPLFLRPIKPTATKVSGNTYLLSNPGYNELVTLVGDDLYIFDATQGEDRAREDAEIVRSLFPGRHQVFVVLTDLAWPHVAGVRYWVASGATIISHKAARSFLQSIIDRPWVLAPDLLERSRGTTHFKFVAVDGPYLAAGGKVAVYPIDGIGSEVALMTYLPADHFLWTSDFIQTVDSPTLYATEVWNAVQCAGIRPESVAAEHLGITPWGRISAIIGK